MGHSCSKDHHLDNDSFSRGHSHCHNIEGYSTTRIIITIILNLLIGVVEVIGGLFSGSLSLVSDALHNFSDALAVFFSFIAIKLSSFSETQNFTFGLKRGEIVAAFVNSSSLIIISFFLLWESFKRLFAPSLISVDLMMLVSGIGFFANFAGMFLLQKDSVKNINMKSAYIHLLGDAVISLAVFIGAICIKLFAIYWIDPVLTIVISLYIIKASYSLLKKSIVIFMMGKPENISIEEIKTRIEGMDGIENVHHAHLWMLTDELIHFESHIEVNEEKLKNIDETILVIENVLKKQFNITHSTLQVESAKCCDRNLIKERCHKS